MFLLIALFSTSITFMRTFFVSESELQTKEETASRQLLTALDSNLSRMINHVEESSNTLFLNQSVQNLLRQSTLENQDQQNHNLIMDCLTDLMLSDDCINSVILCDNCGNVYNCWRNTLEPKDDFDVKNQPWYQQAINLDGDFLFESNADVIKKPSQQDHVLSMIRVVKDRMNYQKLGILIINIDEDSIRQIFGEAGGDTAVQFYVFANQQALFRPTGFLQNEIPSLRHTAADGKDHSFTDDGGNTQTVIGIKSKVENWSLLAQKPQTKVNIASVVQSSLLVVFADFLFLILCSVFITLVMSRPLQEVQKHIQSQKGGVPRMMPIKEGAHDEISEIKIAYNNMQRSIQELIEKVRSEEDEIAKNKIALIQSQIQPHFLYNTLDAISALALEKDDAGVFQITQALGNFYRTGLSNGNDFIPLKDEIEYIRNYMVIMNIRFDNRIHMEYSVEQDLMDELVPKMLLQPCVENSVQHGIRGKHGEGVIRINCFHGSRNQMVFSIWDDGVGMDQEKIDSILSSDSQNIRNFGLYSLIQRISLLYGLQSPVRICSQEGKWTEVVITILKKSC